MKIYSNDVNVQDCYVKTIKRLEYQLRKDGQNKVIERINKKYYWLQYKKPFENDTYYNSIRTLITESQAYAAIQQAEMDFVAEISNLSDVDAAENKELSKEDERKLLRKEWMNWVGDAWYRVLSRRISIEQFNNVSYDLRGKVRRIGDLEAWGYNMYGDDLRACMKFAYDRFINKVFKLIENPSPNKTRWTFDNETGDIYCIGDLYISGEAMEPYINLYLDNNFEIVKKFENVSSIPNEVETNSSEGIFDECFLTDEEVFGK